MSYVKAYFQAVWEIMTALSIVYVLVCALQEELIPISLTWVSITVGLASPLALLINDRSKNAK